MSQKPLSENSSKPDSIGPLMQATKEAVPMLAEASEQTIHATLHDLADRLDNTTADILAENAKDIASAKDNNLPDALIDRLSLNQERLKAIAQAVRNIAAQPNPVGRTLWETHRPNGLHIQRISVPFGVLGMIYESRPNVTIDAAALCLKSRNTVILRGGSECLNSALALHGLIQQALIAQGLPKDCVTIIPTTDRALVSQMLKADAVIDVMIPRGGKGLIEKVRAEATMPVFSHLDGICHVYVDRSADKNIAVNVAVNAKMRRTGICGAMETLLLDRSLPQDTSSSILSALQDAGCALVGDADCRKLDDRIEIASEKDWASEYLAPILACKFVDNVTEAIAHINHYGSHHTDSIISETSEHIHKFMREVDSGIVLHNASTQFADGGEFGMGAEIGIATGKMHARGPVGLEQLTTYKYLVHGSGQIRPS